MFKNYIKTLFTLKSVSNKYFYLYEKYMKLLQFIYIYLVNFGSSAELSRVSDVLAYLLGL